MNQMHIRLYTQSDAQALSDVFHESVHQIGRFDYPAQQLSA